MLNRVGVKLFVMRLLGGTLALTALLLLALLALASANTEFFDRYYSVLYAANVGVALVFMLILLGLVWIIIARIREGRFGTRLLAKLAIFSPWSGCCPAGLFIWYRCSSFRAVSNPGSTSMLKPPWSPGSTSGAACSTARAAIS